MEIDEAVIEEASLVLEYIQKKAEFDGKVRGEPCEVSTTLENIEKTMFGDTPFAKVIFARNDLSNVVGFALYHIRYSSFSGKPYVWLDDLLVDSNVRSKGIGKQLMQALRNIGMNINASHLSWNASTKNIRGQKFYDQLGAVQERQEGSLLFYRYDI